MSFPKTPSEVISIYTIVIICAFKSGDIALHSDEVSNFFPISHSLKNPKLGIHTEFGR